MLLLPDRKDNVAPAFTFTSNVGRVRCPSCTKPLLCENPKVAHHKTRYVFRLSCFYCGKKWKTTTVDVTDAVSIKEARVLAR